MEIANRAIRQTSKRSINRGAAFGAFMKGGVWMTWRRHVAIAAVLGAIGAVACGCSNDAAWTGVLNAIEAQYPEVERITTDSLASWMAADNLQPPLLLDVRSPEEYAVSHLIDAVRIDPDADSFPALDTVDRHAPLVAYCSVGYRSSEVALKLQRAGFTNVKNLEGSIFRWANEGRPVYRGGEQVREVHPYNAPWGRLLRKELHSEKDEDAHQHEETTHQDEDDASALGRRISMRTTRRG